MAEYSVTVHRTTPRTIAAVRARLPLGTVSSSFGRYLDQVYAAGKTGAVQLDGQNIFLYECSAESAPDADVAFGVGVKAPFSTSGAVEPVPLPAGEVATTTHFGNYAKLGAAHDAVTRWCREHDRRLTGTSWEVYGHWTEDESQLRTDVFYLLAPAGQAPSSGQGS